MARNDELRLGSRLALRQQQHVRVSTLYYSIDGSYMYVDSNFHNVCVCVCVCMSVDATLKLRATRPLGLRICLYRIPIYRVYIIRTRIIEYDTIMRPGLTHASWFQRAYSAQRSPARRAELYLGTM